MVPAQSARARWFWSPFGAVRIGLLVIIVAIIAGGVWGSLQRSPQAGTIPEKLAGFRLINSIEGTQALQIVDRLHFGFPQLTEAWVADYEQGGVIWVGITTSLNTAREQVEAMSQAIGKGGTPFSIPQEIKLEGRPVFSVADSSNNHYFFHSGAKVIWIMPPRGDGLSFVEAALREL